MQLLQLLADPTFIGQFGAVRIVAPRADPPPIEVCPHWGLLPSQPPKKPGRVPGSVF